MPAHRIFAERILGAGQPKAGEARLVFSHGCGRIGRGLSAGYVRFEFTAVACQKVFKLDLG